MSLVDYTSSSEDEEAGEDDERQHDKQDIKEERPMVQEGPRESATAATIPPQFHQSLQKSSTYLHPDVVVPSNAPSMERLPDASILLSSPSFSPQQYGGNNRFSHIASGITKMASRKRERNGSAFVHPSNKNPRGSLPNSRSISDTSSSTFIPPQLKGRSNVVTEDLRKLFVKRHAEPSG
ncbi:uncharacterized protein LOC110033825 [Phalaenopsis equestris]|uniref:uncharacterized protein LOC110033825 n=1 Tax=Phalaenopsis equestris TaxID=78828 RepID=UPI0009E513DF|nr:uncharacterized protein LOC110033825 [Phalaenopsis equestris]